MKKRKKKNKKKISADCAGRQYKFLYYAVYILSNISHQSEFVKVELIFNH